MTRVGTAAAYLLVLVLTVELAVWGAFLTPARLFGLASPVAGAIAVVGNLVLGMAGARVLGRRLGAVLPGALWLIIALALASKRSEELVVLGNLRGLAYLAGGSVAAACAVGLTGAQRRSAGATPEGQASR